MYTIKRARYKIDKHDDFSSDILIDASETSEITEFSPDGQPIDTSGNKLPGPVHWKISLRGIPYKIADDLYRLATDVQWQLEVNGDEAWETDRIDLPEPNRRGLGTNIVFRIGKDQVRRHPL